KCCIQIFEVCRNFILALSNPFKYLKRRGFLLLFLRKKKKKLSITIMTLPLRQFQILQYRSFRTNCYIVTLILPKGSPTHGHIPTMQVTVNTKPRKRKGFLPKIVTRIKLYLPFRCYIKVAIYIDCSCH